MRPPRGGRAALQHLVSIMTEINAKTVMALRGMTGAPMMDCKAALIEAGGDLDKAKDVLRKRGKAVADKASSREVKEGRLFSYVHHNGKIGVLAEIVCETDFVARNEEFLAFGRGVCLTAAAYRPEALDREALDPELVAKEREIVEEQTLATMKGKPQQVVEKAIEGRLDKFYAAKCLLEMPYVNPEDQGDTRTVEQVRADLVAKIGENIRIRRFTRLELGA
ncbi:MAG: translation elongation factor Ts [Planctomycetota bacterium]